MAITKIDGIPVYRAVMDGDDTGMFKISLVDAPAVMSDFQTFAEERRVPLFCVSDEEKRLALGCVMRADFPIYRYDRKNGEYYIIYGAETIREMAEKYLLESRQNDVNLQHVDGSDVDGVQMVQYFIKDAARGIIPAGFDDIADGSLFAEFHVVNDEVWDAIKAGTYKGFSLEGVFSLVPDEDPGKVAQIVDALDGKFSNFIKSNFKKMGKLTRFLTKLAQALSFGSVTTDKGVLVWDGDDDLKAGDAVFIEDADGNRTPAADGDYKTTDQKTIVVEGGKVSEIKDPEAEVSPAELAAVTTDQGELHYDGEGDLKAGDKVYILDADGNAQPAADGDYKTEDGKVIKVENGEVVEISDPEAAVEASAFGAMRQKYEESYDEKFKKIAAAVAEKLGHEYFYIVDAGDDFAVVLDYSDETAEKYYRFGVAWDEAGEATIVGNGTEVKPAFVPVDVETSEMFTAAKRLKEMADKLEKLEKQPACKAAHLKAKETQAFQKTGVKALDNIARIMAAK